MKNHKSLLFILVFSLCFYSCSTDMLTNDLVILEESSEDPEDILSTMRIATANVLTGTDEEVVWRIDTAELVNANGSFDISDNFNVNDDEFIFKKTTTTSKSPTAFEIILEWRQNSAINLTANSAGAALLELYLSSQEFTIRFEEGSSVSIISTDGKFKFTIAENGTISGTIEFNGVTIHISLVQKMEEDYETIPTHVLSFSPRFNFQSNAIARYAPDMIGSLTNHSIYITTREDDLGDPGQPKPERVFKYDLDANRLDEKLTSQPDFADLVSKQLLINDNKLLAVNGQKIHTYDLDITGDPIISHYYASQLGLEHFSLSRHGTAVRDNLIYVVGGAIDNDAALANRIYTLDIETQAMTEFAIMPESRFGARAEIINDKLYIFGGTERFDTPPAKNTIYIYDLITAALTVKTMPNALHTTYIGKSGNLIYVAGNVRVRDNGTIVEEYPTVSVYDTVNETFIELQTNLLNLGSNGIIHSMTILDGEVFIIYGEQETVDPGFFQTWQVLSAAL